MGRSQWFTATAWHETALPVPVQAAAIIGESIDETRARITVMDKDRRMLHTNYTFIFIVKAIGFRVAGSPKSLNFLINTRTISSIFVSIFQLLWFTLRIHIEVSGANWLQPASAIQALDRRFPK
jgi:hypothetical protein